MAETPPGLVEAKIAEGNALEHRLTVIETAITAGFERMGEAIQSVDERVKVQNSRIGKLEEWKHTREKALAFARGIAEGRAGITKTQLAALGVFVAAVPAVIDITFRLLGG